MIQVIKSEFNDRSGTVIVQADTQSEALSTQARTLVLQEAGRHGVARAGLSGGESVYPVDDKGDMTMREALGRIAVANAGNWTITDEGKLLLVGLNSMPAETHYLITETGSAITFGGVRILV